MKFVVRKVNPEDLERAKSIYGPDKGDFCAAALPFGWPLPDPTDVSLSQRRAEWSCQQQKDILVADPSVRFMQVVDVDNNDEPVALGRWHRYPNGAEMIGNLEICGCKDPADPGTWPEGFDKDLFVGIMTDLFRQRSNYMGSQNCWVLTNLATRQPLRKRGAGTLLLEWGLEQAAKDGVPAYLEAALTAVHLYESVGFREVGRMRVTLAPPGRPGPVLELVIMRADPSKRDGV